MAQSVKNYEIIFNGYVIYDVSVTPEAGLVCRLHHTSTILITIPKYKRLVEGNNRFFKEEYLCMNLYYPTEYDEGNSLLVEFEDGYYMLITSDIYLFKPNQDIIDFYSVVTNSGMTVPVMIGEDSVYCFYWGEFKYPKNDQTMDPTFHSYDKGSGTEEKIDLDILFDVVDFDRPYQISGQKYWEKGGFTSATLSK